ncbi:MAG: type I-C CRISPR-associated protein Cas7/Csd2 [Thermoplasmataceae archaeon]
MSENKQIENRYDFVILFDVKDGNPNGDPDAGNLPRIDAETGHGLVTDVSLKRKIRNYVEVVKENNKPYAIFIKEKAILNRTIDEAYSEIGVQIKPEKKENEKSKQVKPEDRAKAKNYLCENFFDIRTFGAVMTTGANAGQVRGPVQLTFGRSIDPVVSLEHSITRMAVTTEKESGEQEGENRTMGRKFTIPYALYRAYGFVSAPLANQTGFNEDDLALLWEALERMFDQDRSAARGLMNTRKLIVFKHSSKLGNASSQILFDSVKIIKKESGTVIRDFSDYEITIAKENIPDGVTLIERI